MDKLQSGIRITVRAVIIQNGMKRMYVDQENIFYYITGMNENYEQPALPAGSEEDILKGMYLFQKGAESDAPRVQLLGSGTIFPLLHKLIACNAEAQQM